MDVCLLINQLAPGGAPTLLLDIVRHTDDSARIEYTVCFIEGDDSLVDDFETAGARVVDFGATFKFDPRSVWRMIRFFREERFDVIHAHLPYSQTLGRLTVKIANNRGTVVSTQHDFPRRYHPITRALERLTRRFDSATIAVSQGVERAFTGSSHVYPECGGTWSTIYNGVDVEGFATRVAEADGHAVRERHSIDQTASVILNVGRFTQPKAQVDLIRAMVHIREDVPDAHLLIVGWGDLRDELTAAAREYDVDEMVTIVGPVNPVEPYYAAADAFALSSVSESFGIVLVEAMAATLPVVATDIPGVREVVEDERTGYLVPPESPKELAGAIVRALDSTNNLGTRAYERALSTFDIRRTTSAYLNLYSKLCDDVER